MTPAPQPPKTHALIFANGSVSDGVWIQQLLTDATPRYIIAADGGAQMAFEQFGQLPHIILGDLDSLSAQQVTFFEQRGVQIERFSAEKDETDLELALKWAVSAGARHIRVIGALGRRIDQTFGNVYLMALPELANVDVRLVDGVQQLWLLPAGEHRINGQVGDTLSLIPLQGDAAKIHTQGLYYPLTGETLSFGPARGVSNVFAAPEVHITFEHGVLLVVHTWGRAE